MKHRTPRTQKRQKPLRPAPITEFEQRLLAGWEARRGRVAAATGGKTLMDVGLPLGNAVVSPAMAHTQLRLASNAVVAPCHRVGKYARRENLPRQNWNERAWLRGVSR